MSQRTSKIKKLSKVPATSKSKNTLTETISKYFPSKTKPASSENVALNNSTTSDDDFMSPRTVQKRKNLVWNLNKNPKQKTKTTRAQGKSKNSKNSTLEIIQDNFAAQGENLDHLQMAIALSKSTFEAEYGQSPDDLTDKESNVTDIIQNVKATNLERFGFKTSKSLKPHEQRRNAGTSLEVKTARNRFKFITPILEIRSSEEREALIDVKISHILKQCNLQCRQLSNKSIVSFKLQDYLVKNDRLSLFKLDIFEKTSFYAEDLNLPKATCKPGCLFKDWKAIPGRDESPERLTKISNSKNVENVNDSIDEPIERDSPKNQLELRNVMSTPTKGSSDHILSNQNLSPDLFQSDNDCTLEKCFVEADSLLLETSNTNKEISSQVEAVDSGNSQTEKIIDLTGDHHIEDMDSNSFKSNSLSKPASFYSLDEFENEDNNSNLDEIAEHASFSQKHKPSEELIKLIGINKSYETSIDPEADQTCSYSEKKTDQSIVEISDDSSSDHETSMRSLDEDATEAQKDQEATFHTPTFTRWSCLRKSYVYNSADLNVTDYVNNILTQEEVQDGPNTSRSSSQSSQQDSSIADEELNYSSHFSTPKRPPLFETSMVNIVETEIQLEDALEQENETHASHQEDPLKQISTPDNYLIKTQKVTPMPKFDTMNTPMVNKELQQIGVKPLKRARGVKLLKYIYESTHPIVGTVNLETNEKVVKRRRLSYGPKDESPHASIALIGDDLLTNEKPEDLIFERKQSSKVASCAAPLQIVWHNFLSCNPQIKENILLYEPLQLESLHLMLKELGFKYHMQDLLTFLDKKCITIRIAQKTGNKH